MVSSRAPCSPQASLPTILMNSIGSSRSVLLANAARVRMALSTTLDLTPVGGQTTGSDVKADEGSPHDAGSDTELPARIQTRSRSPGSLLTEQERHPDSQGARRL